MFSYSVHAKVKLPVWRLKDTNFELLFTQTITKRKSFFSKLHDKCCQNYMTNVAKIA